MIAEDTAQPRRFHDIVRQENRRMTDALTNMRSLNGIMMDALNLFDPDMKAMTFLYDCWQNAAMCCEYRGGTPK